MAQRTITTDAAEVARAQATEVVVARPRPRVERDRLGAWLIVGLLVFLTLFPFYWAVRTALSTQRDLLANPGSLLPVGFTLDNFAAALGLISREEAIEAGGSGRTFDFWRYLLNTVIVSTIVAVCQVLFSAMAAYAFARLHFPLRNVLFTVFIAALMVPGVVLLIPNYVLIHELGWTNTYLGIVAPSVLMSPFAIFFLRQFFLGINRDLEEAAKLDGAGYFEIFRRIILPISRGPMATLGIIVFITQWNEYFWPWLVGRSEDVRVLTVALSVFRSQTPQGSPDWPGLMAGTILASLPIVVIFAFLGRRLADSIQFTGIK
jgi:multiple sugar transport system permease protein